MKYIFRIEYLITAVLLLIIQSKLISQQPSISLSFEFSPSISSVSNTKNISFVPSYNSFFRGHIKFSKNLDLNIGTGLMNTGYSIPIEGSFWNPTIEIRLRNYLYGAFIFGSRYRFNKFYISFESGIGSNIYMKSTYKDSGSIWNRNTQKATIQYNKSDKRLFVPLILNLGRQIWFKNYKLNLGFSIYRSISNVEEFIFIRMNETRNISNPNFKYFGFGINLIIEK